MPRPKMPRTQTLTITDSDSGAGTDAPGNRTINDVDSASGTDASTYLSGRWLTKVFPNAEELQTFLTNNPNITIDKLTAWNGLVLQYET